MRFNIFLPKKYHCMSLKGELYGIRVLNKKDRCHHRIVSWLINSIIQVLWCILWLLEMDKDEGKLFERHGILDESYILIIIKIKSFGERD